MPISQAGSLNTAALVVPDLYVTIVPPQNLIINGVPTNRIGVVGTAAWGPVNQAVIVGDSAQYFRTFGAIQPRKFDLGTHVATAVIQGAQDFRCVRVTDGTDVAANAAVTAGLTLTSRYTGTRGNALQAALSTGSRANSWRLTIGFPGQQAELFDNIPNNASSAVTWAAIVAAINTGANALRGPSQLVVASVGAVPGTALVATASTFAGGTDGATGVTSATLIGADLAIRTGLYALRGQGCSIGVVADLDDQTQWSVVVAFGYQEGVYFMLSGPSGETIPSAIAAKQAAGIDDWSVKVLLGDYVYFNDQANGSVRVVSPQGFAAGRLANLAPHQSSLNKNLYGLISTQRLGLPGSGAAQAYSTAELTALGQAGIDVLTNPAPGGAFFAVRFGHNGTTDPTRIGDNYTRMTNFLTSTVNQGMGRYVGQVITRDLFQNTRSTLLQFLGDLLGQGMLGVDAQGNLPYSVICDASNNPLSRTGIGYVQADVQVRYLGINEKFIVNIEGGTTVQVSRTTLPSGQR